MVGEASGMIAIGASIAIGIAAIATAWAQKTIGSAAVGAAAENDKMFGKGLVYMVLPETIVLFGLVIAFMLIQKM
jgi:V/A-type H+-transporting ATPase subunit K